MSFLNPVSEPVKRFSSTDANAPQINYNARVAGDIKTVIKACLVTGYGDKPSAGWSIVNEVDHVAEFVSPSVAMSDYRLGIDDTSTSNTTWYYQYQDARTNPNYNALTKTMAYVDKTHVSNGWQVLVTRRGILLIELVQHSVAKKLSARITYWGQIKLALPNDMGKNIIFFNVGHNSPGGTPSYFYSNTNYVHANIGGYTSIITSAATSNALSDVVYILDTSAVDLVSPLYITSSNKNILIGEMPAMLSKIVNKTTDLYGFNDTTLDGRSNLNVCAGLAFSNIDRVNSDARTFLVRTDYWEY